MPVAAPTEGYAKMIAYGQKKAALRSDQLALQSFLAGFWVAIYGHCCTVFAASFYKPGETLPGVTKLAYGALFPGAFVAVVYTGTELFTGNTVTMIMLVFNDGWGSLKSLARVWAFSLVGNFAGAVFGAFFFSYLSGVFVKNPYKEFLFSLANSKIGYGFGEAFVLGVGCNALVCLATWCVVCSDDGAGKILAMFYSIGVFAMGGFEHIVANFYTLTAAPICGFEEPFWKVIVHNWIPVLLGNIVAGTVFTGSMWWYALHPQYSDLAPFTNEQLATELTRRVSTFATVSAPDEPHLRWKRDSSAIATGGSRFFAPHHLVPNLPGGVATQASQNPLNREYSILLIPNTNPSQPASPQMRPSQPALPNS